MPAKLSEDTEKVCWRVYTADIELLRVLFPDSTNAQIRAVIRAYCDKLRRDMGIDSVA